MMPGSERVWIVDPLDGTINFAHGLPFYAVCVGLRTEGRSVLGVVYNPETQECFEARSGEGAFLKGAPIRVSTTSKLIDALVATGFPYSVHEEMIEALRINEERLPWPLFPVPGPSRRSGERNGKG